MVADETPGAAPGSGADGFEEPVRSAEPASADGSEEPVRSAEPTSADGSRSGAFVRWRNERPFGAGLSMILGGSVILTPAYLTFDVQGLLISISSLSGVSTLLIGILLIVCGVLTWRGGDARILTGVTSLILAIVALPTSNFGGFIVGTVLAMIGGALALSWSPGDKPESTAGPTKSAEPRRHRRIRRLWGLRGAASFAATIVFAATIATPPTVSVPSAAAAPGAWGIPGAGEGWSPPAPPALPLPAPVVPGPGPGTDAGPGPGPGTDPGPGFGNGPGTGVLPGTGALPGQLPSIPSLMPGGTNGPDGSAGSDGAGSDGAGSSSGQLGLHDPPSTREGELAVSDTMEIITADSVRLLGNVRVAETAVTIPSGEVVQAIRLDADRVELDNLGLQAEGVDVGLTTAPGTISTLTGNFHIIARSLTVTPAVSSGELIPITIDARWIDDAILESLAPKSLGLPDEVTDELILRNVSLESFMVRSDQLQLPSSATIS